MRATDHWQGHIQLIGIGTAGQTTDRLFRALKVGLEARGFATRYEIRRLPKGTRNRLEEFLACWRLLDHATVLVIHTPLMPSLLVVAAAVARRVPVVAYVWDIHPESTVVVTDTRDPIKFRLYWLIERLIMVASDVLAVPSADYISRLRPWRRKVRIVPLWPSDDALTPRKPKRARERPILVAFAGQINASRGLMEGVPLLKEFWLGHDVELHIFSDTPLSARSPEVASENGLFHVIEHGPVSPRDLQQALSQMDYGWVCLDPAFALPAFPSKSLAYMSAGIPVLFSGPNLAAFRGWLQEAGLGVPIDRGGRERFDLASLVENLPRVRDAYYESMQDAWFSADFLTRPRCRRLRCRA